MLQLARRGEEYEKTKRFVVQVLKGDLKAGSWQCTDLFSCFVQMGLWKCEELMHVI